MLAPRLCQGDTPYMNRRLILASSLSLLGIAMFVAALRADEIKLKDGTKITGTIVGFEENSFK